MLAGVKYAILSARKDVIVMSKQEALSAIAALPDSVSFADIIYRLYVLENVRQGEKDIEEGRFYTQAQVEEQVRAMFPRP